MNKILILIAFALFTSINSFPLYAYSTVKEMGVIQEVGPLCFNEDDEIFGLPYTLDTGWKLWDRTGGIIVTYWRHGHRQCEGGVWDIGEALYVLDDETFSTDNLQYVYNAASHRHEWMYAVDVYNSDRNESKLMYIEK